MHGNYCYDVFLRKIIKQHIQVNVVAMEIMKMHNVWLYLLHPTNEVPRGYMLKIGLLALDA